MQENFVLSSLKLIFLTALVIFLGLRFFQDQSLEAKYIKTHDKVEELVSSQADAYRRLDQLQEEVAAARTQSLKTYERFNALLDAIDRGVIRGGGNGGRDVGNGGGSRDEPEPPTNTTEDRNSEPSIIAGMKVYPRNPGWIVLCDKNANKDPAREIPQDKVDWNATLYDYAAGEPKGLNYYGDDRTATLANWSIYVCDQLAMRKTSNIAEWNAQLAERVEESPDHLRHRVYLRRGVRWHDPEPTMLAKYPWLREPRFVTAEDVAFTVGIMSDPDVASPLSHLYDDLEEIKILDKYTVEYVWKRPVFYSRPTVLELRPMPKHIWGSDPTGRPYSQTDAVAQFNKHWFGKSMCGNGPYRFVEYKRGEYIKMTRNETYYGPRATCKEFYTHIVRDHESRLAKFWNEEIWINIIGMEQYRKYVLEGDDDQPLYQFTKRNEAPPKKWDKTYFLWQRPMYAGFGWNQRDPRFSDKRVRRALTHALNRGAVVDKIYYGLGSVVAIGESIYSPYFHKEIKPLAFDLEAAKKLLEEAGWVDGDGDGIREKMVDGKKVNLAFELLISSASSEQRTIAQMYQEDLLRCGAKMTPKPAESAIWSKKIHERSFDGFIIFWSAGIDSDPKQLWDSTRANDPGSNNYTGFQNKRADEIFDTLISEFDLEKRKALFREWYEIEFDEQPYTWIWSVKVPVVVHGDWRVPEPQLPTPKIDRRLMFRWKSR